MTHPRPHSLLMAELGVAPNPPPVIPRLGLMAPAALLDTLKGRPSAPQPPTSSCLSASFQTRLPAKQPPSRTCTQMPPLATSRAATPSTSSWASAWPGPWPPSTGPCRDRSSTCQRARWPSLSPSSPSSRLCASACSCTAGGPTWAGSWAALVAASWPRPGCL